MLSGVVASSRRHSEGYRACTLVQRGSPVRGIRVATVGEESMYGSMILWFFLRKAKIAFLALMIYASLC